MDEQHAEDDQPEDDLAGRIRHLENGQDGGQQGDRAVIHCHDSANIMLWSTDDENVKSKVETIDAAAQQKALRPAGRRAGSAPGFTLPDVAREAGVSEITVSRVIRSKGPIAPETRCRVERAILMISYVPNGVAGALTYAALNLPIHAVLTQ